MAYRTLHKHTVRGKRKPSTVYDIKNSLSLSLSRFYCATQICIARTIATATWLGGWLGVCHGRYCIKTTKPILKLFQPSGSTIIEAFRSPCADTKFQGEPLHRGRLIHGGWKKSAIFNGYYAVYLGNGAR